MDRHVQITFNSETTSIPVSSSIHDQDVIRVIQEAIAPQVETDSVFGVSDVVKLYNQMATQYDWVPCVALAVKTSERISVKLKEFPSKDDWKIIFTGLSYSLFSSPKRKRRPTLDLLVTGNRAHEMYNMGHGERPKELASPEKIIDLYNEYAKKHKWQVSLKVSQETVRKLGQACRELPDMDQWQAVMRGWLTNDFFGGRREYRPNIMTMIFKSRYMEFYNAGIEAADKEPEQTVDDILDGFREMLKAMP